jgi:muramoyltetrapeptide carboxypeptidase LdcA involved in peptidoglycan recycling
MLCQFIDEEINNQNFFLVSNMDFWHTYPQIILPYWKRWIVDFSNKTFSVID